MMQMTPKQKYDEAKRLRTENRLRQERRAQSDHDDQDYAEAMAEAATDALCRIADALERLAPPKGSTP